MTNIAFHAANALVVLAIARAVAGLSFVAATCDALAFAVLPLTAMTRPSSASDGRQSLSFVAIIRSRMLRVIRWMRESLRRKSLRGGF